MKADTIKSHQERVLRILVEIESNLSGELSLETLARQGNFSPYHFHRVFSALVGEPVKEYVRRLRLERAAQELAFNSKPIIQIAFDAGFETHESFTRAFRAALGSAPSEYRRSHTRPVASSPAMKTSAAPDYDPRTSRVLFSQTEPRQARVERLPRLRVAFIRHIGPYDEVPLVFNRLSDWVRERQSEQTDLMLIGLPHDNPYLTPPDKLRFDCCVMIEPAIKPAGETGVREIGGDLYATTTHYGSFDRLVETYGWLGGQFIPSAGLTLRQSSAIEIYLNNPETTPHNQLLTDILLPVESLSASKRARSSDHRPRDGARQLPIT